MKKYRYIAALLITLGLALGLAQPVFALPLDGRVVVVDAGHGGWDPGMVSGKVDEKDINLAIAKKLQSYLELGGAIVIITRENDDDLARNKSGDMAARRLIANTAKADIFVSIHQNAFGSSAVHGAQTFYFDESGNSKKLAEAIQHQLKTFTNPGNRFNARANDNYFVLKQTEMPAVLVECGFLTNPSEKSRLLTEKYQEKVAWGIYMGIVDYFYANVGEEPTASPPSPAPE